MKTVTSRFNRLRTAIWILIALAASRVADQQAVPPSTNHTRTDGGCGCITHSYCVRPLSERLWDNGHVPSSKMSNLLFLSIARARAMICLCPADKFIPPEDTCVPSSSLSLSESCAVPSRPCASRSALFSSSSRALNSLYGSKFC